MIIKKFDSIKAVIIQIADIFNYMPYEEFPEDIPWSEEKEYHLRAIEEVVDQARKEGYTKWKLMTRQEAEQRGQNIGINGVYLVLFKK